MLAIQAFLLAKRKIRNAINILNVREHLPNVHAAYARKCTFLQPQHVHVQ